MELNDSSTPLSETQTTGYCAVMFADVAGSTKLYDELGDERANAVISQVISMMQASTEAFSGVVIKTIGDEVMCRFDTADDAAKAAIQIQEKLELGLVQGTFVAVRIGFHCGAVIFRDDGDLFGDTVNVAARMAGIAKGRQIILTQAASKELAEPLASKSREFDKIPVKGKAEELRVCELVWEETGVTRMISIDSLNSQLNEELKLMCGDVSKCMTLNSSSIQLGRSAECDLVVNADLASRMHAKISIKRGKFVLADQSTNGTFVMTDDGQESYLRREELVLNGSGTISLGSNANDCARFALITYNINISAK
ncbi:MAG: adenylate/guanylate cyclase domain-containing protein [Gammaproteobacteria bacterium]|nr:MAG: adenylate/guanylate cyclase domain-containing protein [Gammaproteobacteria bacterium]